MSFLLTKRGTEGAVLKHFPKRCFVKKHLFFVVLYLKNQTSWNQILANFITFGGIQFSNLGLK